jgi:hypothetical protein
VQQQIYPEARHEVFNETNRDEVIRNLIAWLDGVLRQCRHDIRGKSMSQVQTSPTKPSKSARSQLQREVGERDIQLFAAMSGDHNPVHLDAEFAATTMFKERIAHGMFSGALISAAVRHPAWPGHHLPRPEMRFRSR